MAAVKKWQIRPKALKRFQSGHPWVFSNELAQSPKGIAPGTPVELQTADGKFLARGYGNPSSLIAFRVMSRDPEETDAVGESAVLRRLIAASHRRAALGRLNQSHRLVFSETDSLPGLIVDCYALETPVMARVFVLQILTAGMERLISDPTTLIRSVIEAWKTQELTEADWATTAVILRNDSSSRRLEGLEAEPVRVLKEIPGVDLREALIQIPAPWGSEAMSVDLIEGQKTGFFLDQIWNIDAAIRAIRPSFGTRGDTSSEPIRILDLFSYVGQWGTLLGRGLKAKGRDVEIWSADASATALKKASFNAEKAGLRHRALKLDLLEDMADVPNGLFDIVICDPPALIKSRKHLPTGQRAYLKINTEAMARLKADGGWMISCSCSHLMDEETFAATLARAAIRSTRRMQWYLRGSQAPDHPVLLEFPEGRYLKMWLGRSLQDAV